jgi:N-acetylneuraminate lyase
MQTKLAGIFPALVTPLNSDGSVHVASLEKLLDRVYAGGVDGVYVCGSTGEGVLLPEEDRKRIVETVARNTPAGRHVVVHVGSWSLDVCERLAKHAESVHAAAISSIRPVGVNHAEMMVWYRTLASSTSLPFYAYYFPASTGEPLNVDQLTEICEMPGVGGIKYTDYDLYTLSLLSRAGYQVFNGRDEVLAAGLLMGACGGIGSIYNLIPERFVELNKRAATGEWAEARALQDPINDLIRVLVRFPFLPALKQVLTWEGIECGGVVRPRTGLSAAQQADLRSSLAALHMFESL